MRDSFSTCGSSIFLSSSSLRVISRVLAVTRGTGPCLRGIDLELLPRTSSSPLCGVTDGDPKDLDAQRSWDKLQRHSLRVETIVLQLYGKVNRVYGVHVGDIGGSEWLGANIFIPC